jgi:F-type H+-transporting ATPase subunit delta
MSTRLENNKVAARYAKALFESVVESGDVDAVSKDLETVNQIVQQLPSLISFMENPGVPAADKMELVSKQFDKSVSPWVSRTLKLLVENGRFGVFPQLVQWFTEYLHQHENVTRAEVVTAVELEAELKKRIQKTLESTLGFNRVEIQSRVEPGILGGVIIKVQDRVIDGSYVGRLEEMRKHLVKT